MNSSTKIDYRKNNVLILGKGPMHGLPVRTYAECRKNVFD